VAHLTARQLVGLEDRRDRLDAFERLEAAQRLLAAIVAHRTDHGAERAADRVGAVAHRRDPMANVLDLDIGSSGLQHDDHLSVLCSGCLEAGSDRGWPETGATPAPKRPFNRRPGSARPLRRFCLLALLLVLVPWFLSRSLCHRLRSSHRPFLSDGLAGRPKNKRPREWARGLICAGAAGVRPARGPLSSSSQSAWADLGEVEEREESVPARRGAHSVSASLPSEVATVK